jgi:hypothetical protein
MRKTFQGEPSLTGHRAQGVTGYGNSPLSAVDSWVRYCKLGP